MHNIMQLLIEHGYVVLFVPVLAERFGLPVSATPFLIAAGALAGRERLSLAWSLAIATSASLISDYT
jgi:membrane protein DedA with SNARE-associated domain